MPKLLIASNNPGKLREIQAILNDPAWELLAPTDLGLRLEVDETGSTYQENAALKALAFAGAAGLPTLADDSGLEVDALDGAPGLHSARFAPWPHATDADRRRLLLEKLAAYPQPWLARFRCWVALAVPGQDLRFAEGICEGCISPQERGSDGFGYDRVFLLPELGLTMAELSAEQKNTLSHRARALQAIRPTLYAL